MRTSASLNLSGGSSAGLSPDRVRASVIIVNHNGRKHLGQCLHALSRAISEDIEIILVDNGSSDGSAAQAAQDYPDIQIIQSGCNHGYGWGNNLAARRAQGAYLAFLNPDTVVSPGWLDALITALEQDRGAGLATSKILLLREPGRINACGNEIHCSGLTICRGVGQDRNMFSQLSDVPAVSGAAFVIRRNLFDALNGFDPCFFMYMEDTDLSWRARQAGWRTLYVPGSIVWHDYTLRFNAQKVFYQERNRYLMFLKSLRWPTLIVLLPTLLLAEFVTWGFVLLRDRHHIGNKVRAYGWIRHHWPIIMSNRARCHSLRRIPDRQLLAMTHHRLAYGQVVSSPIARLAALAFDWLFFLLFRVSLTMIRW